MRYAFACTNKNCNNVFNQTRDHDDQGRYEVTPSNRSVTKTPNRCSYLCGLCRQPKKGHVCPYAEVSSNQLPSPPSLPPLSSAFGESAVDLRMKPVPLPIASDAPPATAPATGTKTIKTLGLKRYNVCADGSCIEYAVLACAGLCEHGNKQDSDFTPTPLDRGRDAVLRTRAYKYLCNRWNQLDDKERAWLEKLMILPQYPLLTVDDMGTFGNMLSICAISHYIGRTIVAWHAKTLRERHAKQQVAVYDKQSDTTTEQYWTADEILQAHLMHHLVHIEWDGFDHYAALIGKPVLLAPAAMTELMHATRIGHAAAADQLPSGWSKHVDKFRDPRSWSALERLLPVHKQCSDAQKKGYDAFLVHGESVYYLFYKENITDKDLLDVADDNITLYTRINPKKGKMPPETDFQCCKKMKLLEKQFLECNKCYRSFHASCVFERQRVSNDDKAKWLEEHKDKWVCLPCYQPLDSELRAVIGKR